jgi:hypothetical protein
MKATNRFKISPAQGLLATLLAFFLFCLSCKEDAVPYDTRTFTPPDPNRPTKITSYFPDSGGLATKLILFGENFGTDTSCIKVTVNDKKAAVINSDGEAIYAIVPRQADTGYVKVFIKKGALVDTFTYENPFRYFFQSNVSTYVGIQKDSDQEPLDGNFTVASFRRPWHIAFDSEAMYIVEEGRGQSNNGALRKVLNGDVSTIVRNNAGMVQSPVAAIFSLDEDTLFLMNKIYSVNDISTKTTVGYFLREDNFSNMHNYVTEPEGNTKATGMTIHPVSGDLFYYGAGPGAIYMYNRDTGQSDKKVSLANAGDAGYEWGKALCFNNEGTILYIVSKDKHCIYRSTYDAATKNLGAPVLWVGQEGKTGHQDGLGQSALFNMPGPGTIDQYNNLFVADRTSHCIRKITPEGVVTTYAGVPGESGYKDGDPETCLFNSPECVIFNKYDFGLYVADRYNHVIRKIMVE